MVLANICLVAETPSIKHTAAYHNSFDLMLMLKSIISMLFFGFLVFKKIKLRGILRLESI